MSNFAIHPAEPFKQLAISGYLMDTHMSFHIKLNIFVLNFFFPEECSMQKKGAIDNNERNDKACDAEAKIDYGNLVIYFNVCLGLSRSVVILFFVLFSFYSLQCISGSVTMNVPVI